MNTKKSLYEVPVPSTSFTREAYYDESKFPFAIRYGYIVDNVEYRSGIQFGRFYAMRTLSENCCDVWHIDDAYDTLVEVEDSTWVEELQARTVDKQRRSGQKWPMRHYMIYLDSVGCYEIISDSWQPLPQEPGTWESS